MNDAALATLDDTVRDLGARLAERGAPAPQVLFLMATGVGLLAEHLRDAREIELADVAGMPAPWDAGILHAGRLGPLSAWLIDDVADEELDAAPEPPWVRGLFVWLAAAAGAGVCVHTAAGSALPSPSAPPAGSFAFLRDHINLSGRSPLLGVGESRLGPLFPDLSLLHHLGLRRAALERADKLGLAASEAVAACTLGPSLETPAERTMLARVGADVAVQGLAPPLIACGHAGLACLAIVAVTDDGTAGATGVAALVEAAAALDPALEDLLLALPEDLARAVQARDGAEA